MGMFNDVEFLGGFIVDAVTNALMEPTAAIPVLEANVAPLTTEGLFSGPRPLFITNIQVMFQDIAVSNPSADRYLGWAVWSSTDGSATPTYASVAGYTANADLPLIHDNSVSTSVIQAVENVPVDLFNYVGVTRDSPDLLYATQAKMKASAGRAPIRIAANAVYQVRVGTYLAGSLAAVTGVDNLVIMVYGKRV